jgi:hypothetical protein
LENLTGGAVPPSAARDRAPRVAAIDPTDPAIANDSVTNLGLSSWVSAPAYDDEHPEELSYRPFPLGPYMTATGSPDDPALARMVHPDAAKTLELLDQAGAMPPMKLRPGAQVAQLLWAQQFKGAAVALNNWFDAPGSVPDAPASRRVKTSGQ